MMTFALVAMTAGVLVNAHDTLTPHSHAVTQHTLSADEQAFAAKLSDQARRAFADKLTTDQRHAVMAAVKSGANADEAVAKFAAGHVAIAETPAAK